MAGRAFAIRQRRDNANADPLFAVFNVVTFAEEPENAPHIDGMEIGWNMSLYPLAPELAGKEIV